MTLSDLRSRGLTVGLGLDGRLRIGPAKRLTPALRKAIKANRERLYRAVIEESWRAWMKGRQAVERSRWRVIG